MVRVGEILLHGESGMPAPINLVRLLTGLNIKIDDNVSVL